MVTIFDVAARAGVSKSTVSLVLNSSPLVKEETRQKVLEAIKALKYVPNYNARSLIRRNNNSIGFIHISRGARSPEHKYEWSYSSDFFMHDVEEGIFEAIARSHSELSVLKDSFDLSAGLHNVPGIIKDRRVDGAIFIGGFDREDDMEIIKSLDIPIVMVSSQKADGFDSVLHSPYEGSRQAFRKLAETGHKRICLINCPKSYFRVWPERLRGVMDAARDCGCEIDERLLISAEKNTPQSAYEAFNALLSSGLVPDGVITANNEMALGLMRSLYEHGINVPKDISVICYEDSMCCGYLSPALSAVNIQKEKIGEIALSYLIDRINDPSLPVRTTTVEPCLVMRQSVISR